MDVIDRALADPENQPSQWGTVPLDDPNWVVSQWHPIAELNRTTDNTYLVRVEDDKGRGYINKGYFADDSQKWSDDSGKPIERHTWRITAFAGWPEFKAVR